MTGIEIVAVAAAVVVAALLKSITGMGFPLILIPTLALVIDVTDAVIIVAPANLFLNTSLVWDARRARHDAPALPGFLVGGVMGGIAGSLLLSILAEETLRWILIVVVVLFLVNRFRAPDLTIPGHLVGPLAPVVGTVAGVFQGAAGISGPLVTPWFLSLGLSRETYVFSIAAAFALSGGAQIAGLTAQGLFTLHLLGLGAALVAVAALLLPVGVRLRRRVPVVVFERLVIALLAASALTMILRAV